MRALMIAITMAAALPACSKRTSTSAGPAVVAGATVGVVVEIAGTVTATRGGATRTLAAGAEVSGDDRIATGADGKVAIELAHNGARWSLGANKSGVVAESVAWDLPKVTGPRGTNEEDMSSAGRHAERSAAETSASTGSGSAIAAAGSSADTERQQDAQNESDREAAKAKLQALQKEKAEALQRLEAAKREATRHGVKISQACLDDPLAKGCDGTNDRTPADAPGGNGDHPRLAIEREPKIKACVAAGATVHVEIRCHAGTCMVARPIAGVDAKVAKCLRDTVAAVRTPIEATFTVDVKN